MVETYTGPARLSGRNLETVFCDVPRYSRRWLVRAWVNQPSTLQAYSAVHGENLLVSPCLDDDVDGFTRVIFVNGDGEEALLPRDVLADGWTGEG